MDPNANLSEQRSLALALLGSKGPATERLEQARRLAELVAALDDWMARGGFLPRSWTDNRHVDAESY